MIIKVMLYKLKYLNFDFVIKIPTNTLLRFNYFWKLIAILVQQIISK